jgi:hypothetical protein
MKNKSSHNLSHIMLILGMAGIAGLFLMSNKLYSSIDYRLKYINKDIYMMLKHYIVGYIINLKQLII